MLASSPPRIVRNECIKPNNFTDVCDYIGTVVPSLGLHLVYPISAPRADTATTMITELLTGQAQEAFGWQEGGPVDTPVSCNSFDPHGILVRSALLYDSLKTMVPDSLRTRLFD